MDSITIKTSTEIEQIKSLVKSKIEEAYNYAKGNGCEIYIKRYEYIEPNPIDFEYRHRDEVWKVDYKITND